MKKLIIIICLLLTSSHLSAQSVKIDSIKFIIKHGPLTFYLDNDTASYISLQNITVDQVKKLTGVRSDKWHKEPPYGSYNKEIYVKTGYDLGHLTPSNITSYNDSLNYHSFSLFNQAPQLAAFNRGKWAQLENKVEETIISKNKNAVIITGVIYNNLKKEYLNKSKIKIPLAFYKIVVFDSNTIYAWLGSNINGLITDTDIKTILEVAKKNGNNLYITVKK